MMRSNLLEQVAEIGYSAFSSLDFAATDAQKGGMKTKADNLTFETNEVAFKKKTGKNPKYKVTLKSPDGHSLTLVSESRAIWDQYPEGETFQVTVKQTQRTIAPELAEFVPEGK